jgi:WD40 repeat protein
MTVLRVATVFALVPAAVAAADAPLPDGAVRRLGATAFQGSGGGRGLVVVPGGKQLVTADQTEVILWDLATGRRVAAAPLPAAGKTVDLTIPTTAFMSTNTRLATDGTEIVVMQGPRAFRYALPPDGKPTTLPDPGPREGVVTAGFPAPGRLFALTTAGRLVEYRALNRFPGWLDTGLPPVKRPHQVFAAGGGVVAIAGQDGKVRVWDATNGKDLGSVDFPDTFALAASADGKVLAALGGRLTDADRSVRVWGLPKLEEVGAWKAPQDASRFALSPDGSALACGCIVQAKVEVYEAKSGKLLHTLREAGDQGKALEFLPDGSRVFAVGMLGVVRQWDARTGEPVGPQPVGHTGGVRAVVPAPGGGWFTAGEDRTVRQWGADGKEVRKFAGHAAPVTSLALSRDGKVLYSACLDCTVRAWDVGKGAELRKYVPDQDALFADRSVQALALSPDGKTLALGVGRGAVRLLDADTLKPSAVLGGEAGGWTVAVAFLGGKVLATRDSDHLLHVWDLDKKEEARAFRASGGDFQLSGLAASPDGQRVASPTGHELLPEIGGKSLGVWDSGSGKLLARIDLKTGGKLSAMAFSADGKLVYVGDGVGVVRVVDVEKRAVVKSFVGHQGPVHSLAVSADGKTVASGGADTTVLVWDLTKP